MADLREKQPDEQTLDLTKEIKGSYQFSAEIQVWPYSSIKNEDVYSRKLTIIFGSQNMRDAHGVAQSISAAISLAHDVWQTNVWKIWVSQ